MKRLPTIALLVLLGTLGCVTSHMKVTENPTVMRMKATTILYIELEGAHLVPVMEWLADSSTTFAPAQYKEDGPISFVLAPDVTLVQLPTPTILNRPLDDWWGRTITLFDATRKVADLGGLDFKAVDRKVVFYKKGKDHGEQQGGGYSPPAARPSKATP